MCLPMCIFNVIFTEIIVDSHIATRTKITESYILPSFPQCNILQYHNQDIDTDTITYLVQISPVLHVLIYVFACLLLSFV